MEPITGSKGFMLIELLVVLALTAMLLVGVARAALLAQQRIQRQEAVLLLEEIRMRAEFYHLEHGTFPSDAITLNFQMPAGSRWGVPVLSNPTEESVLITLSDKYRPDHQCILKAGLAAPPTIACTF